MIFKYYVRPVDKYYVHPVDKYYNHSVENIMIILPTNKKTREFHPWVYFMHCQIRCAKHNRQVMDVLWKVG
jgi:hypothetical protein